MSSFPRVQMVGGQVFQKTADFADDLVVTLTPPGPSMRVLINATGDAILVSFDKVNWFSVAIGVPLDLPARTRAVYLKRQAGIASGYEAIIVHEGPNAPAL